MSAGYDYKTVCFDVGEGCFDEKTEECCDRDRLRRQRAAREAVLDELQADGWQRATIEEGALRGCCWGNAYKDEKYVFSKKVPYTQEAWAELVKEAFEEACDEWRVRDILQPRLTQDKKEAFARFSYKTISFDDEKGCWNEKAKTHDQRVLQIRRLARDAVLDELAVRGWEIVYMNTNPGAEGGLHGHIFLRKEPFDREALEKLVRGLVKEVLEEGNESLTHKE